MLASYGAEPTICAKSRTQASFLTGQMSNHEITFNTDLSEPVRTRADFTYKITPEVISIVDTGLDQCSVTDDIEAVLRKIEYWHQGAITAFKIMYRDERGVWNGVRWDGQCSIVLHFAETDEKKGALL
jgi:hypothetical protein